MVAHTEVILSTGPHKSTRPVSGNLGCGLQFRIARRQSQANGLDMVADKRHFMAISK
jgi:hypothetical protein